MKCMVRYDDDAMMMMMIIMYAGRDVDQNKTSTKSSTIMDTDDVRTSRRLSLQVGQEDMKDGGLTLEAGSTGLHHVSQSLQSVADCRLWPRLDVSMATRIQPSSIVELGIHTIIRYHIHINVWAQAGLGRYLNY